MSSSSNESASDPSSPASGSGVSTWCHVSSKDDEVAYVVALQSLGIHMAKSVPKKVAEKAITELGVVPTTPLLIGNTDAKTKERTLKPSCKL